MSARFTTLIGNRTRLALRQTASVRDESKLKVAFVTVGAVGLWLGLFALAYGLLFGIGEILDGFGGAGGNGGASPFADLLINRLISIAALALSLLLFASNLVIAHAGLLRSDETRFLLATPIAPEKLFLLRFSEGLLLSSWASAFMASPALLAYGLIREAPIAYYPAAMALSFAFALVPAALASLVMVTAARWIARLDRTGTVLIGLAILAAMVFGSRDAVSLPPIDQMSPQRLLAGLAAAGHPLLPSTWFADGLMAAARGALVDTVFPLALLLANAMLLVWIGAVIAHVTLIGSLTTNSGTVNNRDRRGLLSGLERLLGFVPQPARALVAKDIRDFWRDPAQWVQFLLFFGLLALYAGNLRDQSSIVTSGSWRSWIAVLNVSVCLLVLATLTTRFVFPLVSLEGKRWWLIGLAPVDLGSVLRQKLALAAVTSGMITVTLAALSAHRLDLDAGATALTISSVLAGTIALSGLAIGLGSLYPNFDEDQPARIVSGLGGTLSFLLSMAYVILVASGLALVFRATHPGPNLLLGVGVGIIVLSILVTWLPMRLGLRHLERLGF